MNDVKEEKRKNCDRKKDEDKVQKDDRKKVKKKSENRG
jgi:hypothetical protein